MKLNPVIPEQRGIGKQRWVFRYALISAGLVQCFLDEDARKLALVRARRRDFLHLVVRGGCFDGGDHHWSAVDPRVFHAGDFLLLALRAPTHGSPVGDRSR